MKSLILFTLFALPILAHSAEQPETKKPTQFWEISGKNQIRLNLEKKGVLPYQDNIEMAGKRVAGIISYKIDAKGQLKIEREIFFPQLHHFKTSEDSLFHNYRAYLQDTYQDKLLPKLYIGDEEFVLGKVGEVTIDGILNISHTPSKNGLQVSRSFFPSMDQRLFLEKWTIQNTTKKEMKIRVGRTAQSFENFGAKGKYRRQITCDAPDQLTLAAGETQTFSIGIAATIEGEDWPKPAGTHELKKRTDFLKKMAGALTIETPDPILNTLFEFSKIRASESIFESELGLIHSPGGGRYYVGIWANDQAEYINPFFSYLGYQEGHKSAMNCYRAFAKEMNPQYQAIRYSFEIEGLVKPFPKDRGDAAMIAYGAAHYAMATGDLKIAKELWPSIQWCLEYCHRQLNPEGVVMSESDEMEGRVETGTANLSTSALYYGALDHAIALGKDLGETTTLEKYQQQKNALHQAIENYFGATVEGLETYKYYKEHTFLRHWICLPLVVGINDRKDATIQGLFENLWTDNGVHVEKNSDNQKITKIFWDRGTLYALRGTFVAGATKKSLEKLTQFSEKRLLGERVPYVVEAYPEGGMAHLSAESALYCRVFLEGLFGLKPTGLKSFQLTPHLPENWDQMSLRNIKGFGEEFDITILRKGENLEIILTKGAVIKVATITPNTSHQFHLTPMK